MGLFENVGVGLDLKKLNDQLKNNPGYDVVGNKLEVGDYILFHPTPYSSLRAEKTHLKIGLVTKLCKEKVKITTINISGGEQSIYVYYGHVIKYMSHGII